MFNGTKVIMGSCALHNLGGCKYFSTGTTDVNSGKMRGIVDPFKNTLGDSSKVMKAKFKHLVHNPDKSKISCIDPNTGDMVDVSENISVAYF
jgi:hypothetical protein